MLRRTLTAVLVAAALVCPAGAQDAYLIGVTGAIGQGLGCLRREVIMLHGGANSVRSLFPLASRESK
jgi:hypothetical protein